MESKNDFFVWNHSPMPCIKFFHFENENETEIVSIGYDSGTLLSYNFSKDIHNLYGDFEIRFKEDYDGDIIMDKIQPLDIVKIYEKPNELSFIGIVQTVSFGATAGAFNKSVSVSGASIGILFEMFNFSTDSTSLSFFTKNSGNLEILDSLTSLLQKNVENGGQGISFSDGFQVVYNKFVEITSTPLYARIAANGINDMIKYYFGVPENFIKSQINFNYQITKSLFNSESVNLYDYFKSLLPDIVYEFYEDIQNNKPVLVVREHPFDNVSDVKELQPSFITDYTFTRSDKEIYTSFYAMLEGSSLSKDFYKIISTTEGGSAVFQANEEKTKKYGYKPLITSFAGYAFQASKSENESNYLNNTFVELSKKIKKWYENSDEMFCGDVTICKVDEKNPLKIGEYTGLCGGTFYVTSEKHSWSYGNSIMVNYTLERGGTYSADAAFKPLKNVSKAFSELLKEF